MLSMLSATIATLPIQRIHTNINLLHLLQGIMFKLEEKADVFQQ